MIVVRNRLLISMIAITVFSAIAMPPRSSLTKPTILPSLRFVRSLGR